MYRGMDIVLATKHKKEIAINQPFNDAFSANIFVPNDFDTDVFGTFTGEVEREGAACDVVIKKAKSAVTKYGYDFSIASEGSFGPHPTLYFMPADIEHIVFVDLINDITVLETLVSTETNYSHIDIGPGDRYTQFLERIYFGSHGIVLRSLQDDVVIEKGIIDEAHLSLILKRAFKKYTLIRLETDMRAIMNPTRMQVIKQLTIKLVNRLSQHCLSCGSPGFGKLTFSGNLPCKFCGTETNNYRHKVLSCIKCDRHDYFPRDDMLEYAGQEHCPFCNP